MYSKKSARHPGSVIFGLVLFALLLLVPPTQAQTVTYTTDFETTDSFSVGNLDGQNGWQVVQGTATVTGLLAFSGSQSVTLAASTPPAIISRSFTDFTGQSVVFIDFFAKPTAGADVGSGTLFDVESSRMGLLQVGTAGEVYALDGDGSGSGTWVDTGHSLPIDQYGQTQNWVRFTFRQDYSIKKWDLYVDGLIAGFHLGFRDNTKTVFSVFNLQAATAGAVGLDDFLVTTANPLFEDTDNDGLPDAWEMQYLGTLAYGPNDDPGGVGRTLAQSYAQGLSPWPAAIVPTGLRAWYRADLGIAMDGSNKVSQWTDLSGSGLHVVQTADSSRQPTWTANVFNAFPAVQFNGSTVLATAAQEDLQSGSSDVTVIAVVKPEATQGYAATIFYWGTDGNLNHGLTSEWTTNQYELHWDDANGNEQRSARVNATAGQVQVISAVKASTMTALYLNGAVQGTNTVSGTIQTLLSPLAVGNAVSPYYGFHGQIAEVLVYNRALTDTERQSIEAALQAKYISPDSDGDGLPDAWEMQYLGTLAYGANDDPGGVGRTLLQSYQQGLSPWPTAAVPSGLRAWYRSDLGVAMDSSNNVSQWTDVSGHGFHVVQTGTPDRQPSWTANVMNGNPVVSFDGSKALLTTAPADLQAGANDVTVITVMKPAATQGYASTIYYWGTDGNVNYGLSGEWPVNQFELHWSDGGENTVKSASANATAGQVQVLTSVKSGTTASTYLNSTLQGATSVPSAMGAAPSPLGVGNAASPYYGFNGQIAEVLVYNRALTDTERQGIEQQLMTKYITADSDGDGLPDAWEMQYLGTLAYGANDDPGGVGRTLLQSYQQGLSPWPTATVSSGLRAWYRADLGIAMNSSNNVSQWTDLSGSGFHVVQTADVSRQPLWTGSAMNGNPAVNFDGAKALVTPGPVDQQAGANDMTVIAVVKPDTTQGYASTIYSWGTDGNVNYGLSGEWPVNQFEVHWADGSGNTVRSTPVNVTASQVQVLTTIKASGSANGYVNGVLQGTTSVPALMGPTTSALSVGNAAAPYYGFHGQIAEILVYNRALSDTERQQAEQQLMTKYISADSDGNGLPDAWENQYFGHIGNDPASDPGGVDRTLLQSYQQGLSPWPTAIVPTGLRAWYRSDLGVAMDSSNNVSQWNDLSGSGFHVAQTANPSRQPVWTDGVFNSHPALTFDGSKALITAGPQDLQAGTNDVTVIAVVKPQATQGYAATIFYWGTDGNLNHGLTSEWTANQYELHWDDASGNEQRSARASAAAGQVQVISAVKNSTATALYLNGAVQGTNTVSGTIQALLSPLAVGNAASPYYGFNGQIAEVLVYNRALTDSERQSIETALQAKYITPPSVPASVSGLRLFLKADTGVTTDSNGNVTLWQDQSGLSNDATAANTSAAPQVATSQLNGNPVIRFDGVGNQLTLPNLMNGATQGEIFIIARLKDFTNPANGLAHFGVAHGTSYGTSQIWDDFGIGDGASYTPPDPSVLTQTHIYNSSVTTDGTSILRFNNTQFLERDGQNVIFRTDPLLGADWLGEHFNGDVAEVIVYDHVLSDTDRATVTTYLTTKYAVGTFVPTAPTLSATATSTTTVALTWSAAASGTYTSSIERQQGSGDWVSVTSADNTTTYTDTGLTPGQAYSYRVKESNPTGQSPYSVVATVTLPTVNAPPSSGVRLWLKADAGITTNSSGNVTLWQDQSGLGNDAIATNSAAAPLAVTSELNGNPVVRFDGVGNQLNLPNLMTGATQGEIFIIARLKDFTNSANGLAQFGVGHGTSYGATQIWDDFGIGDGSSYAPPDPSVLTQPHVYNSSVTVDGTSILRFNSVEFLEREGQNVIFRADPVLGADRAGEYFNGDIAEVIVYDHVLSDTDRATVTTYLTTKYAVGTFVPTAPTLSATATSTTTVALTWSAAASGTYTTSIERQQGSGGWVSVTSADNTTTYTDTGLTLGQTYSYRVKESSLAGESPYSPVATVTLPTVNAPPAVGVRLWLKADVGTTTDSNGNLTVWQDQSGLGNDATAADTNSSPQVIASQFNGNPVVRFNGTTNQLNLPNLMSTATQGEIIIVAKLKDFTNSVNGLAQFGVGHGTSYGTSQIWDDFGIGDGSPYSPPDPSILTHIHIYNSSVTADGTSILRFNNVDFLERDGQSVIFRTDPLLGADWPGEHFNGDIAEVIVYDHALSDTERITAINYLTAKYAVGETAPVQPTMTATPTSASTVNLFWSAPSLGLYTTVIERQLGSSGWISLTSVDNTTSFTDTGLAAGQTYSYRITQSNAAGVSPVSEVVTVTLPSLGNFPSDGMRLWLRADFGITLDANGGVSSWLDRSGSQNTVTQVIPSVRPQVVANAANGQSVVRFDGVSTYLDVPTFMSGASAGELFVIVKLPNFATRDDGLWTLGGADGTETEAPATDRHLTEDFGRSYRTDVGIPVVPMTSYVIYNVSAATGTWTVRLNGQNQFQATDNTVQFGTTGSLGRALGKFLQGDIAEVVAYDRVLTDAERAAVASDLNNRYAVVVSPDAPASLTASVINPESIGLSWTQPTSALALTYSIERKTGATGDYAVVGSVTGTATYTDTVAAGTTYVYRIKAISMFSGSSYSNEASVTTPIDTDGDGVSDADEIANHTDPLDYYNGKTPVIKVLSGDGQWGGAGQYLPAAVVFVVTKADGTLLRNAPLTISVPVGGGQLSQTLNGPLTPSLSLRTDNQGQAAVFVQLGATPGALHAVQANSVSPTPATAVARINSDALPSYTAIALIPGTLSDADALSPIKLTNSGYALLGYTTSVYGQTAGQRWQAGSFTPLPSTPVWDFPLDTGTFLGKGTFGTAHTDDPNGAWWANEVIDINETGDVVGNAHFGYEYYHNAIALWPADGSAIRQVVENTDIPYDANSLPYYIEIYNPTIANNGSIHFNTYKEVDGGDVQIGLMSTASPVGVLQYLDQKPALMPLTTLAQELADDYQDYSYYVSDDGTKLIAHPDQDTPPRSPDAYYLNSFTSTMANPAFGPINNNGRYITESDTNWADNGGALQPLQVLTGGSTLAINNNNDVLGKLGDGTYTLLDWNSPSATGTSTGTYLQNNVNVTVPTGWSLSEIAPTLNDSRQMLARLAHIADANGTPLPTPYTRAPAILVQAQLSVDADRDGVINPNRASDQTSASAPFRFWLNDGIDGNASVSNVTPTSLTTDSDSVQQSFNPTQLDQYDVPLPKNSQRGVVTCTRDLDNFARLWISITGLSQAISSGKITVGLEWHSNTGDAVNGWGASDGSPAINIYAAAPPHGLTSATGGTEYLTDPNTATDQSSGAYGTALGSVVKGTPFYFTAAALSSLTTTHTQAYFLFEGVTRGTGRLVITFNTGTTGNFVKIGESSGLFLDLKNIKELYERWTVGDGPTGILVSGGGPPQTIAGISQDRLPSGVPSGLNYSSTNSGLSIPTDPMGNNYILFVHGWNMAPWEKDAFAETALKRLYWQGYKGKFGTFQWPTTYFTGAALSTSCYDDGEFSAWRSATPLSQLLVALHGGYGSNVYVFAHSMGNVVAGEALRIAGQSGAQLLVNTYVATQAAVPGACYDPSLNGKDPLYFNLRSIKTPNIYDNWLNAPNTSVGKKANFCNVNDFALTLLWEPDQVTKPDSTYNYVGTDYSQIQDLFQTTTDQGTVNLHLGSPANVRDRYQIMAYAAQPRSIALGAILDASASAFGLPRSLPPAPGQPGVWPEDTLNEPNGLYSSHAWHSAEFLFTNADQQNYWNALLKRFGLPTNL